MAPSFENEYRDGRASFSLESLSPLLNIDSLESLTVVGAREVDNQEWSCAVGTSNVKFIKLCDCIISSEIIKRLVSRCKKLQSFSFWQTFHSAGWTRHHNPDLTWGCISRALVSQQHSLEATRIRTTASASLCRDLSGKIWEPFGSPELQHFEKLEILEIHQQALVDDKQKIFQEHGQIPEGHSLQFAEILPSSIKSLELHDCDVDVVPQLEAMLEARDQRFPNLQRVYLECFGDDGIVEFNYHNYLTEYATRCLPLGVTCTWSLKDRDLILLRAGYDVELSPREKSSRPKGHINY